MAKAEATFGELIGITERGEPRLPEMQRRYVWRPARVRDLKDFLYRGYPSGTTLIWGTGAEAALQGISVSQKATTYGDVKKTLASFNAR